MHKKRIDMIVEHVYGSVVADIGTDHAFVPVKLIDSKKCNKVIATDVNIGPLNAAKSTITKNSMEDMIETRLGSGLSPLRDGECDTIIIAGMGGELICDILSKGEGIARGAGMLIIQPMNAQELVRQFLNENNYSIVKEDITVEGFKVYNLIVAKSGGIKQDIDEFSLHLPNYLFEHKMFYALLAKKKREFSNILKGLSAAHKSEPAKIEKYSSFIKRIELLENKLR